MVMKRVALIVSIVLVSWGYQSARPPAPKVCGSRGGPPITAPRIKLRDGRHLAYKEHGLPRHVANYKIISVHGFSSYRNEAVFASVLSKEFVEELSVYIVGFDRPGYGESDPDPNRTTKSLALDIEELGDQLRLGPKFYVLGYSMGGQLIWTCLKYIPSRLAGAGLIAPAINCWWPSFPPEMVSEVFEKQSLFEQWTLRVVHHIPWLTYWWKTTFPAPTFANKIAHDFFCPQDLGILCTLSSSATPEMQKHRQQVTQQGESESVHRDMKVGFGKWEFDPMEIENPFPNNEGTVHLWQGDEDRLVPVKLQRYIVQKLPWIHYHEIRGAGHFFPLAEGMMFESMLRQLLLGDKQYPDIYLIS